MLRTMPKNSSSQQVVDAPIACEDQQVVQQAPMGAEQRIVYLTGPVSELSINIANAQLISLAESSDKSITLVISSYGGSIHDMFSLYDTIKSLSCPVHTVGMGKIMSAGVLLLASGEKGKRLIAPHATVMIHAVSSGMYGNVFDLENELAETKRLQKMLSECLVAETKITKTQMKQIMSSKTDTYISAREALKMGIVDKVMKSKR